MNHRQRLGRNYEPGRLSHEPPVLFEAAPFWALSFFSGRFLRGNLRIEVREELRGRYQVNAARFRASRFPTLLPRGGLDAESANWRAEIIRGRRNAQLDKRGPAEARVRTPFLGLRQSKIRRDRHHRHLARHPPLFAVTCSDGCGFRRHCGHAGKMARFLDAAGTGISFRCPRAAAH